MQSCDRSAIKEQAAARRRSQDSEVAELENKHREMLEARRKEYALELDELRTRHETVGGSANEAAKTRSQAMSREETSHVQKVRALSASAETNLEKERDRLAHEAAERLKKDMDEAERDRNVGGRYWTLIEHPRVGDNP